MVAGILLLDTKLYVPKWHPGLVSRPRLIERIHQGVGRKLTLISAPAGFGKTTLLAEWVAANSANKRAVGWVSLESGDSDPALFWAYFIAMLQRIQPEIGGPALALLQSPQPPQIESFLTILLNEITGIGANFTLILDDYHAIEAQAIHRAIAFLLNHLPPQMHLMIASRCDPPWPLARLRSHRELNELRASDLRFTPAEAATFLNDVMGLTLSAADVARLEKQTEGWIAGLQLAALSMQGRDDLSGFIAAFAGNDRYIVDYLLEEVLQRQPKQIRHFLLKTAVLDRLSGAICDAVAGQPDSQEILEKLERENLFVVPLDDKRQWYRYHHLFADVLRMRLRTQQPDLVLTLHRRASEWYEENNLCAEAIRHAIAAEDFARAARLIEITGPEMRKRRQESTTFGWIQALPKALISNRPVLCVLYAWMLLDDGQLDAAEVQLREAETWLDAAVDKRTGMVVVDEAQFRSLPAVIANARAYRSQALGDFSNTITYAQQALSLLPEGDDYERGTTTALLGLAYWAAGDLVAAHQSFAEGLVSLHKSGSVLIRLCGTSILADILVAQGRLRDAIATYEQSLQLAAEQDSLLGRAELHLGLSQLHRERGQLESARSHLQASESLGEQASLPGYEYYRYVAKALMNQVEGDLDGAENLLHQAQKLYYRNPLPDVLPIATIKARVWVKQNKLAEALDWVRQQDLSVDDDLSYLRECEHITLARILIAQYKSDQKGENTIAKANRLLDRLLEAAEAGKRDRSTIEILVIQVIASQAQKDIPKALERLKRALALAEPEGYVRIFVDEGAPMAQLFTGAITQGVLPDRIGTDYTDKLLAAFETEAQKSTGQQRDHLMSLRSPTQAQSPLEHLSTTLSESQIEPLIESLSQRELEILKLIAEGLSNREIGDRLFIALNTVKGHNRRLFNKLDVQRRTEAIARARELRLL